MRFSLQPEPRPEFSMRTLSLDDIIAVCEREPGSRPALEHYFSPDRKAQFIKELRHYINSLLLEARHGNMDQDQYLVLVMIFQFICPLLEVSAEKELGLFFRILKKSYGVEEIDLNLHFSLDSYEGNMLEEKEIIASFREELESSYQGRREVKESVQTRLKRDAIETIMDWQRERSLPALAGAFGRSIVIPSFFAYSDKRLIRFYRAASMGISYRLALPPELEQAAED